MVTANGDIAERNSDRLRVNYHVAGIPDYQNGQTFIHPWATNMNLDVNIEERTRAGGSVLMDWRVSQSTTIKFSNFVGYLNRDMFDRSKTYNIGQNYMNFVQNHSLLNQLLLTSALEGRHHIFGTVVDWGGSRSLSNNRRPFSHIVNFRQQSAFNNYVLGNSFDIGPPEFIPDPEAGNVNDHVDRYYFYNGASQMHNSEETEYGLFLNWQVPFRMGQAVNGYVKTGTKYRQKDRVRTNERYQRRLDGNYDINNFIQKYPEYSLTTEGVVGRIQMTNFLEQNYNSVPFLNGQFEHLQVNELLDRKLLTQLYDEYLENHYDFIAAGAQNDYTTYESVLAYYVMSELNIGRYITFIPGVRYERSDLRYTAYIAESIPSDLTMPGDVEFYDTTAINNYGNILPQIHLRIKPASWFDIRLAYTNTLSRPDYNQLSPRRIVNIDRKSVTMGNTSLDPILSTNYDAVLTFYKPEYGLLTLGAFYKDIEGFLWNRTGILVAGTETDPANFNMPPTAVGYEIRYPLNNANRSFIKGFELDLQSNLNFLPVKGFVLNLNLTLMESQTKYPQTLARRELHPDFGVVPGAPRTRFNNFDTVYVDRLLQQAAYLANVGIGYDNRNIGLSVRLSFNFQDDILTTPQSRPDAADKEGTLSFYRWDFQMNQRISRRLSLNGNIANIFNQPDRDVRIITGYYTNLEYYGYMVQFGLRYNFF
jgi:TonB-dependent receptor